MECGLPARLDAPNHSISFDADTIAAALVNIYQKKYGNGREIEPTLFEKTKEIFNNAVSKGWNAGGSPAVKRNSAFVDALKHNTDVFSAFRVHKMQSDIAAQLLDEKGNLKPFGKFVKDVKPYISHQNRAWLETEYNTAVLRAHQAADWKQFEAEKDVLPNLEWQPSTSPNPGEDHKPYWFTVLPVDHKFWTQHRPGDRWNCKCNLRNTDKPATAVPTETLVKNLQPSKGLDTNPGTTGEIFSNSHPYYPENCGKCPFNKGVGKLFAALVEKKGDCFNHCKVIKRLVSKNEWQNFKVPPKFVMTESELMEVKKNGWTIPFQTAKEYNDSPIAGFDLNRFDNVFNSIMDFFEKNGIKITRTVYQTKLLSFNKDKNEIQMLYKKDKCFIQRVFLGNEVFHKNIRTSPTGEGIGSFITMEFFKQYVSMEVKKVSCLASSTNGGYTWAKMGFCANDLNLIKHFLTKLPKKYTDEYNKYMYEHKDAKTFPMNIIADNSTKEMLTKLSWSGEIDLNNNEQFSYMKDYLRDRINEVMTKLLFHKP